VCEFRYNILLMVLFLTLGVTVVSAAPTRSDCNKSFFDVDVSSVADEYILYLPETSELNESSNFHLAAIGAEILKPPADFTYTQSSNAAKTLPPVPATLFMTLTGFLCVSFVKDRRVWLTALAGLLWAGQAGIQIIPQLAVDISKKYTRQSPTNIIYQNRIEDYDRLRSNIEGTQYIGLLHHLAGIPDSSMPLLRMSPASLRAEKSNNINAVLKNVYCARTRSNIETPQFATVDSSSLVNPAVICPTSRVEQNIYFSPAFNFSQLPRGPPNRT
jgi:hypothetical protein